LNYSREEILGIYDRETRAEPKYPPIVRVVHTPYFVKLVGPGKFTFINYWQIPAQQTARIMHEEMQSLKQFGGKVMCRVYQHDVPKDLENCLANEGFEQLDSVTLTLLPLQQHDLKQDKAPDIQIRELKNAQDVADFLGVTEAAFGQPSPQDHAYIEESLKFSNFKYYLAYLKQQPVGAARFIVPEHSRFGFFFGGCVIPKYRRRGIYSALIKTRLQLAKSLNLEFICNEAKESSRPIMEKIGFHSISKARTWYLDLEN
jgi:GNAT superfamily N-acetyltransferase